MVKRTKLTPTEARQGKMTPMVWRVLFVSLLLGALALAILAIMKTP